jgi:sulfoxide reductase heme-binding subunit YedZ
MSPSGIAADVVEHPWVTVGFTAFVLLIPLALTSTKASIRRLGGRRWQRLHRLIYLSAVGGVLHYLWLVKRDIRPPLTYGAILLGVLALRLAVSRAPVRKRTPPARVPADQPSR